MYFFLFYMQAWGLRYASLLLTSILAAPSALSTPLWLERSSIERRVLQESMQGGTTQRTGLLSSGGKPGSYSNLTTACMCSDCTAPPTMKLQSTWYRNMWSTLSPDTLLDCPLAETVVRIPIWYILYIVHGRYIQYSVIYSNYIPFLVNTLDISLMST